MKEKAEYDHFVIILSHFFKQFSRWFAIL